MTLITPSTEHDLDYTLNEQWVILFCECHELSGDELPISSDFLTEAYERRWGVDDEDYD